MMKGQLWDEVNMLITLQCVGAGVLDPSMFSMYGVALLSYVFAFFH